MSGDYVCPQCMFRASGSDPAGSAERHKAKYPSHAERLPTEGSTVDESGHDVEFACSTCGLVPHNDNSWDVHLAKFPHHVANMGGTLPAPAQDGPASGGGSPPPAEAARRNDLEEMNVPQLRSYVTEHGLVGVPTVATSAVTIRRIIRRKEEEREAVTA